MQRQTVNWWLEPAIGKTLALTLVLCLASTTAALAESPQPLPTNPTPEQLTERILALHQQINRLLAQLPADTRQALEAQLRQRPTPTEPPQPKVTPEQRGDLPTVIADPVTAAESAATEPAAAVPAAAEPTTTSTTGTVPVEPLARVDPTPVANSVIPVLKRRPQRASCNALAPLDENGDGRVSAADRYWRHLLIWIDKNNDGLMQEKEIDSAYARGVREITNSFETFIRTKGTLGEIRVSQNVVLDLRGDGFSERSRRDDGVLLIDASAIARGTGPKILDDRSTVLTDAQPLRAGLQVRFADDRITSLSCP